MSRRKKLTLSVVAILALAAAGVVAIVLRGPSMRSKLEQLRPGMTYAEVVAILGEPNGGVWPPEPVGGPWADVEVKGPDRIGYGRWSGDDCTVYVFFGTDQRLIGGEFLEEQPPGFLDRLRSWFGL